MLKEQHTTQLQEKLSYLEQQRQKQGENERQFIQELQQAKEKNAYLSGENDQLKSIIANLQQENQALHETSRQWITTANRYLSQQEVKKASEELCIHEHDH